jgi:hypothetical protein
MAEWMTVSIKLLTKLSRRCWCTLRGLLYVSSNTIYQPRYLSTSLSINLSTLTECVVLVVFVGPPDGKKAGRYGRKIP